MGSRSGMEGGLSEIGCGVVFLAFCLSWWFRRRDAESSSVGGLSLLVDGPYGSFSVRCGREWTVHRLVEHVLGCVEAVGVGREAVWLEVGGRPLPRGCSGTLCSRGIVDGCTVRVVDRLFGGAGSSVPVEASIVSMFDEALGRGDGGALSELMTSVVMEREESSERWKALSDRLSSLGDEGNTGL